ncbi:helix-turn-helix domain-containing protein [Dysgonomonas sp. OttesenSCG-928-D17]|nr:helix-turn-helix domain-containing protein [Dysgonomonas sp. OttesenSCG-928-D17]
MKYSDRLVEKMIRLIEEDTYTITEICEALKISRNTYYEWRNTKPDFRRKIDEAIDRRDDALVVIARRSLKQKLEGCVLTEERCVYEPARSNSEVQILKTRTVRKKQCPPDLRAIKYVLDRNDKRREADNSPSRRPMIINVPDQHTADMLRAMDEPDYWDKRQKMIDEKYAPGGIWSDKEKVDETAYKKDE